jgi:DNA replication protein DnaC
MEPINKIAKKIADATSKASTPTSSATDPEQSSGGVGDPTCKICHGIGYVRMDVPPEHPDFGKLFPCVCRASEIQQRRAKALREISNLRNLEHFTFETFHPQGRALSPEQQKNLRWAYDDARAYAKAPKGWLLLCGNYGCGKTHLAAAIANAAVAQGLPVLFVTTPDLLDHLRAAFAPGSSWSYDERFDQIRTAPLLILDDLGTENATPWALEKLFQLLNARYMTSLPTVITTNHELEELDPRLRSRLADPDLVKTITILAPDYRGSGTEQADATLNTLRLYADMTFATFDTRRGELPRPEAENLHRALEIARDYAQHPQGWLLLMGDYGCGKTHLAAAIANAHAREGYTALFIVVPDLLDHLRATYNPHSTVSYDRRFEEVRRAPFLVLDDLGTESATPWAQEKLYQLFNYRYVARLPTVITTSKELQTLDPKLQSRLRDVRRCTAFAIIARPYSGNLNIAGGASPSGSARRGAKNGYKPPGSKPQRRWGP